MGELDPHAPDDPGEYREELTPAQMMPAMLASMEADWPPNGPAPTDDMPRQEAARRQMRRMVMRRMDYPGIGTVEYRSMDSPETGTWRRVDELKLYGRNEADELVELTAEAGTPGVRAQVGDQKGEAHFLSEANPEDLPYWQLIGDVHKLYTSDREQESI